MLYLAMGTLTNKELFFDGIVKIFKEQQCDVRLKACDDSDDEAAISAHKLFLSARSEVFKKMFESDNCKASSMLETITLSDLKQKELEAFVEFIYSDGSKLSLKAKQHVRPLYRAADKYEIPYLRDLCRDELVACLNSSNALKVLEVAQIPFDKALTNAALTTIKTFKKSISTSSEFKVFVANHPNLTLEIVKTLSALCYCLALMTVIWSLME
ncbi:PREDICTED: putative BTB/POZ domain-containing protein At2g40440 [Camelina sativa]|uniref:BTB/POZ domain-containing protein At2g40440 n=1 Tax=Camelina sativa TaxID=90675 RepID=A0ABM0Y669_CAMSA|nr:PREDICTED: putative BTB/POZ domain-containing protein At2g40440 [Camelina sativa]